jgi:hypothetical protein
MINAIHVFTQYRENYSDDPKRPYWKSKGGSTYVITGFSHPLNDRIGAAGAAVVEAVREQIEYFNDYATNEIIGWEFADGADLTEDEKLQMEYDGKVGYPDQRIPCPAMTDSEEEIAKHEYFASFANSFVMA